MGRRGFKDNNMIKYKKIYGYKDYEVNEYGDVISYKNNRVKKMKLIKNKKGYLCVCLRKNNISKKLRISRIIMLTFNKVKKSSVLEVNHIDCNKLNNHISNLEWVTRRENLDHRNANGLNKVGSSNARSKLTEKIITNIRKEYELCLFNQKELSKKYNVTQPMISYIVRKLNWKHV